jgi:NAD(P)-dependent dehydrogenase (short-subunit alcohol dehydrogenase family)
MKETNMSSERKVAVITGASQGIGAALVEAYRGRGYRIVAIARSIRRSDDTDILAVPGDIADRRTAERSIAEGVARFGRIDTLVNNAGIFHRQTVHPVHRGRLRGDAGRQPGGILPHDAARDR